MKDWAKTQADALEETHQGNLMQQLDALAGCLISTKLAHTSISEPTIASAVTLLANAPNTPLVSNVDNLITVTIQRKHPNQDRVHSSTFIVGQLFDIKNTATLCDIQLLKKRFFKKSDDNNFIQVTIDRRNGDHIFINEDDFGGTTMQSIIDVCKNIFDLSQFSIVMKVKEIDF